MAITRVINGTLYFDEFDSSSLNTKWNLIPNDSSRYSLVERTGYLKLFHGTPNLMLLLDEPGSDYIFDIRNEYVPSSSLIQAGIIVFKNSDNSLQLLEYYDESQDVSVVYEYLRIERSGGVYTAYGRNTSSSAWELIGSGEFESAGKIGLILIGDRSEGTPDLNLDFVRVYRSHTVQIINIPQNYTVSLSSEDDTITNVKKVTNPYSGVEFIITEVPPFKRKIRVYDENDNEVDSTSLLNMIGGDVYYYGAMPEVLVNGEDVYPDGECFLGYFTDNVINFDVTIKNSFPGIMENLAISAISYEDNIGYQFVTFSKDNINFVSKLDLDPISSQESTHIYGKITRDSSVIPSTVDPFKFNLAVDYKGE